MTENLVSWSLCHFSLPHMCVELTQKHSLMEAKSGSAHKSLFSVVWYFCTWLVIKPSRNREYCDMSRWCSILGLYVIKCWIIARSPRHEPPSWLWSNLHTGEQTHMKQYSDRLRSDNLHWLPRDHIIKVSLNILYKGFEAKWPGHLRPVNSLLILMLENSSRVWPYSMILFYVIFYSVWYILEHE